MLQTLTRLQLFGMASGPLCTSNLGVILQVKIDLGNRVGPCVLGDEAMRSPHAQSFTSVMTVTPCRVLAIPVGLFKACTEVRSPLLCADRACTGSFGDVSAVTIWRMADTCGDWDVALAHAWKAARHAHQEDLELCRA